MAITPITGDRLGILPSRFPFLSLSEAACKNASSARISLWQQYLYARDPAQTRKRELAGLRLKPQVGEPAGRLVRRRPGRAPGPGHPPGAADRCAGQWRSSTAWQVSRVARPDSSSCRDWISRRIRPGAWLSGPRSKVAGSQSRTSTACGYRPSIWASNSMTRPGCARDAERRPGGDASLSGINRLEVEPVIAKAGANGGARLAPGQPVLAQVRRQRCLRRAAYLAVGRRQARFHRAGPARSPALSG